MSADNRVCILRQSENQWAVWEGSASADYAEAPSGALFFTSEIAAIDDAHKLARNIEDSGYLEYGIQVIGAEEQEIALQRVIRDAEQRLKDLKTLGYQCPWYQIQ